MNIQITLEEFKQGGIAINVGKRHLRQYLETLTQEFGLHLVGGCTLNDYNNFASANPNCAIYCTRDGFIGICRVGDSQFYKFYPYQCFLLEDICPELPSLDTTELCNLICC